MRYHDKYHEAIREYYRPKIKIYDKEISDIRKEFGCDFHEAQAIRKQRKKLQKELARRAEQLKSEQK